jgi:hypothetical protein
LYGWYVFIKTTGDTSLQSYLRYVRDKNFGDDKAMGLTQEAVDLGFNFHAYKKIMAEIGQTVTPGNKSDVELPYFEDICELQFLNETFISCILLSGLLLLIKHLSRVYLTTRV